VQHELMPGMALDVGYFRRAWAHFRVTDNLLVGPQDFTRFDLVAPSNPNLPGGGGYTVHGFYDVNPAKFGQVRNLNALSDDYGDQFENFNGVDVTVNSRMKNGVTLQAGLAPARRWKTTATSSRRCRDEQLPRSRSGPCQARGVR
jgi:hypothetical protein